LNKFPALFFLKPDLKRTLLITNDFPPVISGISTVFFHVWQRLDPESHWILTPKIQGGKYIDLAKNLKVIRHPVLRGNNTVCKIANTFIQLVYAKILVLFFNIKLVHAGQIWTSGTIAWLMKIFFRIPYFLWVYGGETTPVYMKNRLSSFWAKKILNSARKIVTNSEFCREEFTDYGFPEEHCPVILPGVDIDEFKPSEPPADLVKKWNPDHKIILLTVARISERKGHDLVIKALPEILKSHPDLLYLIVGKGPDKERLEELASELNVSHAVNFCGFVPDDELPEYYSLCDIYVMPNRQIFDTTDSIEGFGISFIEASACGKPVIGGKSGGAVEAIEEGISGYLVNPDSVEEFSEKVITLLGDDKLRAEIGEKGRTRVENEMGWNSRSEQLLKIEAS